MEASKLGRFELVSEIGRGAMGIVYKAVSYTHLTLPTN